MGVTPQCDTLESFIISAGSVVQTCPSVVFNGENYVVVWADNRDYCFRIGAIGVTTEFTISSSVVWIGSGGTYDEEDPDIAFDGDRCLAVWSEEYVGVRGRFINSSVQPEDDVFTIAVFEITDYTTPKIAFDGNNYFVVWYDRRPGGSDWDVYGQLVSTQGLLVGDKITIATGSKSQYYSQVVFDGSYYFVVWREANYDIYGHRIDTNGNLVGSPIRISDNTSVYRFQPAVAVSNTNFLVAWDEFHGDYSDIYANVDVPIGIEEEDVLTQPHTTEYEATILSGPLVLPEGKNCKVYDICGKTVAPGNLSPGVYFLEIEQEITHKIIKVR